MNDQSTTDGQNATYLLQVDGSISERWTKWFGNLDVVAVDESQANCLTTIKAIVPDQAALLGLLQKLHNLGYSLLEVRLVTGGLDEKGSDQ